jgi:hypothetical protein
MRQPDNLPAFCRVYGNGRPLIGMREPGVAPVTLIWTDAEPVAIIRTRY